MWEIRPTHVLDGLRQIPDRSVQLCITSPPYFQLRQYSGDPTIWGGDPDCHHDWQTIWIPNQNSGGGVTPKQETNRGSYSSTREGGPLPRKGGGRRGFLSEECQSCGAWRGQLGLESIPDCLAYARGEPLCCRCYVCHLTAVFEEVFRVLHPSGCLFLNLGDSYTSGDRKTRDPDRKLKARGSDSRPPTPDGLKPKDLMLIPFRVALALQARGWTLRSQMPWIRRNAMPGSQTDRPTTGHEQFFMLTKGPKYYWDYRTILRPYAASTLPQKGQQYRGKSKKDYASGMAQDPSDTKRRIIESLEKKDGRYYRTTDVWYDSLEGVIAETGAYLGELIAAQNQGIVLDEEGTPIALNYPTKAFSGEHYAAYNDGLITPLLLAGSGEKGCCVECGNPWVRTIDKERRPNPKIDPRKHDGTYYRPHPSGGLTRDKREVEEKGWGPSCQCNAGVKPCTVLDPFSGTGTTGLVAIRHGRDYIGLENSQEYAEPSRKRLAEEEVKLRQESVQLSFNFEEAA